MNSTQFGLVSSIYTLGGLIGALAAGPLSSRYGRLVPLRLTVPFFVIGSLFGAAAPSVDVLSIGRFLSGIGAGASIVVGPIYISEISPSGSKGILGALTQVSINIGILLTQILGYFMNYGSMWRVVLVTGAGLGVLQFFGLAGTVESPEWLGANGKPVLARRTLLQIRSGSLSEEESAKWGTEGEEGGQYLMKLLQVVNSCVLI